MKTLRKIGLLAALALAVAGCGTTTSSSTNASTSTSFAAGAYVGTTSQGLPISFTVTSGSVDSVQFAWTATCADGQSHTNTIALGSAAINSGAFSKSGILDTGAASAVSGKLVGNTASGELSRTGPSAFGTNCTDTGVTWQAHVSG